MKRPTTSGPFEVSELRQDPITGKWVTIVSGRAKRPQDYARVQAAHPAPPAYVATCPFCNLKQFPQKSPTLLLPDRKRWRIQAFPNKFPAFAPADRVRAEKVGPYTVFDNVGFHEVIMAKAHNGFLSRLPAADLKLYVQAWRERHRALMVKPSVSYIQLIENHGPASGGTVEHSHLQIFGIPVIPSDDLDLLRGAEGYFRENGSCGFCDILAFERLKRKRIVWENGDFTVFCPFTARVPYEQWIVPREHAAGFESLADQRLPAFAEAVQAALQRLDRGFHDPAYNMYMYSAPCDTEGYVCDADEFMHFHWHVQILPRLNIWGGFELATGLEIHSAVPEEAAAFLRQQ